MREAGRWGERMRREDSSCHVRAFIVAATCGFSIFTGFHREQSAYHNFRVFSSHLELPGELDTPANVCKGCTT